MRISTSSGRIIILVTALLLTACTQQLEDLNRSLTTVNNALSGQNAAVTSTPPIPRPTTAQVQALQAQLATKVRDDAVQKARAEAAPVIEKALAKIACYPTYDVGRYMGPFMTPDSAPDRFLAPMAAMSYHPKSQCLAISRLDGWKMPTRNALSFRAVYVSDASGESSSLSYELVKQPDGVWLFRRGGGI